MKRNVHVTPKDGKWAVKSAGSSKPAKVTTTQSEAINIAKNMAKSRESELLVHGRNGRIRQKNSYGKDPFPPKG
ncbi:DUF2188 domain-containing protein [Labilibaculum manganireducens]|uniref:DUF2188 domain-containing protein n=1 Tax=Labilibaculum manganireducens TaxID=1940525 RepID=UPI0029F4BEC2|nr:DUF2188 domain-containing protein [Labilibaculum manganireducens]